MAVKYIPYWCTDCGTEIHYPDCSAMEVYIRCTQCSNYRPVLFVKSKLVVVKILDDARLRAIRSLCRLTGNRFEDIFRNPVPAFNAWIAKEEEKRRQ